MKDTRWGELTEVWQSIYTDLKTDKISPIFSQYDIENITEQDIKDLAIMFGYSLKSLTGYTSEYDYLVKELKTLITKLKNKNDPSSYIIIGVPFNLISNAYSVYYDNSLDKLDVNETTTNLTYYGTTYLDREDLRANNTGNLYKIQITKSDSGSKTDEATPLKTDNTYIVSTGAPLGLTPSTLDTIEFLGLDRPLLLYSTTRNIIYNYEHKFVENDDEFLSLNTLKALSNDINQNKRITERVYYEPFLTFEFYSDLSVVERVWTDYLGVSTFTQKSIAFKNIFNSWETIRFGDGRHTVVDGTITDIAGNNVFEWDYINDTNKIIEDYDNFKFRFLIDELQKLESFTELAIFDTLGAIVLYAEFPKVQWDSKMYGNLKLDFIMIGGNLQTLNGRKFLDGTWWLSGLQ